jgi:23S rRNA (guanosine2251-2'-O)-methyltransferase
MGRTVHKHRTSLGGNPRRGVLRSRDARQADRLWLYGIHPVAAALTNPRRKILRLLATENAQRRLPNPIHPGFPVEGTTPKELTKLLGTEAVHQGAAVEVEPLDSLDLSNLPDKSRLVVLLDQITDPHNVGAILRTASALGADAVVTTARHSPTETGVLAKAASGALDLLPLIAVGNLARALEQVADAGFQRLGLDSAGEQRLEQVLSNDKLALVFGAEGKGLRQLTRSLCDAICRLELPGPVGSLNVSNAVAVALYLARSKAAGP